MQHGVELLPNSRAIFRLWAPSASSVEVKISENAPLPLQIKNDGWHELEADAAVGDLYRYIIDSEKKVPDPASRFQPQGVNGPSQILTVHTQNDWLSKPWEETVIYELHVGSFSTSGDYKGVEEKLDYLAGLGITAIELMPIASFEGEYGWGYDGVFPYAPHSAYGTPEALRSLIASAHARGIRVFLDVVYNHFGPAGNYLHQYAKPFFTEKYQTPWGAAIDFSQQPVRDFFIQNAIYWLEAYGFDGLRFDAVHAIIDDSPKHFLTELAETIRAKFSQERHIHLILENDKNEAHHLEKHFDAQWNDDIHHVLHVLLSNEQSGYYNDYSTNTLEKLGRCLAQGFAYQGEVSEHQGKPRGEPSAHLQTTKFVSFIQNHDQIGNRAFGDRLTKITSEEKLNLAMAILLLSPQVPLLFMGEEWATQKPFLYFCDFEGELAQAVSNGRRKEFAAFPEFADEKIRASIPDPNNPKTFENSKLNWTELQQEPYQQHFLLAQKLLVLRRKFIVPFIKHSIERSLFDLIDGRGIEVRWQSEDGAVLRMLANFSDKPLDHGIQVEGEHVWGNFCEALPAWKCVFAIEKKS